MRKGKYGIVYAFYATAAFVLAILGYTQIIALLLAFVIIAERDEWTTR